MRGSVGSFSPLLIGAMVETFHEGIQNIRIQYVAFQSPFNRGNG